MNSTKLLVQILKSKIGKVNTQRRIQVTGAAEANSNG